MQVITPEMLASGEIQVHYAFINFLWGLAFMIASYAIQTLLTPKPDVPKKATLEDFDFPQMEEGTPQSVVFGDVWIEDFYVLWYGNMRTSPIKTKSGKK